MVALKYIDDIIKMEVIVEGDNDTELFFKNLKEQLKESLRQVDILITAQDIRTI
jgi:hypothetical protein